MIVLVKDFKKIHLKIFQEDFDWPIKTNSFSLIKILGQQSKINEKVGFFVGANLFDIYHV